MAIDPRERYQDTEQLLRIAMENVQGRIYTTLPGIIESYDAESLTVEVQPAIQAVVTNQDGSLTAVDLPLLVDVPVVFPRGGNCTLTFPITKGDECLIHFACRATDDWWLQGGSANKPREPRQHSLSDAFVVLGPFSQAQKISDVSTSEVQLRSNDGSTYVALDPAGQVVKVKAPGGLQIDANVTITGNVSVSGDETVDGTITGKTDVKGGDKNTSLKSHLHSGVASGGSNSGPPVP
jgi:hypothetical protein